MPKAITRAQIIFFCHNQEKGHFNSNFMDYIWLVVSIQMNPWRYCTTACRSSPKDFFFRTIDSVCGLLLCSGVTFLYPFFICFFCTCKDFGRLNYLLPYTIWLVSAQDVHFSYTRSHLSALQNCALLFSANFQFIFIFKKCTTQFSHWIV